MNSIVHPSGLDVRPDSSAEAASPEVVSIQRRRTISPAEKRRILQAYDLCKSPGEKGALLRRERVYSSMLSGWRKHDQAALSVPRRGTEGQPGRGEASAR